MQKFWIGKTDVHSYAVYTIMWIRITTNILYHYFYIKKKNHNHTFTSVSGYFDSICFISFYYIIILTDLAEWRNTLQNRQLSVPCRLKQRTNRRAHSLCKTSTQTHLPHKHSTSKWLKHNAFCSIKKIYSVARSLSAYEFRWDHFLLWLICSIMSLISSDQSIIKNAPVYNRL